MEDVFSADSRQVLNRASIQTFARMTKEESLAYVQAIETAALKRETARLATAVESLVALQATRDDEDKVIVPKQKPKQKKKKKVVKAGKRRR